VPLPTKKKSSWQPPDAFVAKVEPCSKVRALRLHAALG
jgi:hypothetical protein